DRAADFAPITYFIAVKLGATRPFAFCLPGEPKPFFSRELPAGSAVFVRCNAPDAANGLVQHGVPAMTRPVGFSGSIVARSIATVIPWAEMEKRTARKLIAVPKAASAAMEREIGRAH